MTTDPDQHLAAKGVEAAVAKVARAASLISEALTLCGPAQSRGMGTLGELLGEQVIADLNKQVANLQQRMTP